MRGKHRHSVSPCDSEGKRTWDVYRLGIIVTSEMSTRKRAREHATWLDDRERSAALERETLERFKRYDPKGWCGDPRRGAALGRADIRKGEPVGTIAICQVPLSSGGYDTLGTYWGGGSLYWYADEDGMVDSVISAEDADAALATIRAEFPSTPLEVRKPIGPCPECKGSGIDCRCSDCDGSGCAEGCAEDCGPCVCDEGEDACYGDEHITPEGKPR